MEDALWGVQRMHSAVGRGSFQEIHLNLWLSLFPHALEKQTKSFCLINLISDTCLSQHDIFGGVTFGAAIANVYLSYTAIGLSQLTFLGEGKENNEHRKVGEDRTLDHGLVFLTVICRRPLSFSVCIFLPYAHNISLRKLALRVLIGCL